MSSRFIRRIDTITGVLEKVATTTKTHKNLWLAISFGLFASVVAWVVFSNEGFPSLSLDLYNWFFLLVAVCVTILLNAARFWILMLGVGNPMAFMMSLEITLISSAANLLPLPAGMLIRLAHLNSGEGGASSGLKMLFFSSMLSASLGMVLCAIPIFTLNILLAGGIAFAGLLASIIIAQYLHRVNQCNTLTWPLVAVEVLAHLSGAFRMYLCLTLLKVELVDFIDSLVYIAAFVAGLMVVVAPAGLGVVEGASGLLSIIVGIEPAVGVSAAIINRVTAVSLLSVSTLVIMLINRRKGSD